MGLFDRFRKKQPPCNDLNKLAEALLPQTEADAPMTESQHLQARITELKTDYQKIFSEKTSKEAWLDDDEKKLYSCYINVLIACDEAINRIDGNEAQNNLTKLIQEELRKKSDPREVSCFEDPHFRTSEYRSAHMFSRADKSSTVSKLMMETAEFLKLDLRTIHTPTQSHR